MLGGIATEYVFLAASILLLLSIFFSKLTTRFGIPALLIFLTIGMLAGSDSIGGIHFNDARVAQSLGVLALVFILFSGGLNTKWSSTRPVLVQGIVLASFGVLFTALAVTAFVYYFCGFSLLDGFLIGAIVSSTDAAAVFAILRSQKVTLHHKTKALIELESGSNDPMAVFLTLSAISLISQPFEFSFELVIWFVSQMSLGFLGGYFGGKVLPYVVEHFRLEYEGLYGVLTIAFALLIYGLITVVDGNGFLAVYVAGVVIGNENFSFKSNLIRFHDGISWLMQVTMFLVLGLLVFPSHLLEVGTIGLSISLFLIFIARPVAVFACLAPFRMNIKEKIIISWVGLRGAVPIILATFPLLANVSSASEVFNLVFFIVLTSALLQGTLTPWVAKKLTVDS